MEQKEQMDGISQCQRIDIAMIVKSYMYVSSLREWNVVSVTFILFLPK